MGAIELIDRDEDVVTTTTPNPATLVALAVQQGADIDKLERLMAMQERWEANEARKAYNAAFSAFKAEAVVILKNRTVTDGPLKGKSYAELYSVVNAVTPALSRHGLSASWKITKDEKDWIEVTCTLKHLAGHSESVPMGGPPDAGGAKNAIQQRASTVSYLERYTLKAITGLSEQNDDTDGGVGQGELDDLLDMVAAADSAEQVNDLWRTEGDRLIKKHRDRAAYTELGKAVQARLRELKKEPA